MFENCGSCFAAEQFVDIRLGAKYLLTLTSYYYEREWKFMAMITLQNSRNAEVTVLTNNFIDNYMPGANGEFVKVYIYLLRLLSDTSVPFSLELFQRMQRVLVVPPSIVIVYVSISDCPF